MKNAFCLTLALLVSQLSFSQWQNTPLGTSISDPTYRSGDVRIDGIFSNGPQNLKLNNLQLWINNTNDDLYLNNAAASNGNVQLGKAGGLVTAHNNMYIAGALNTGGIITVGTDLMITNNQICVDNTSSPMFVQNSSNGNGNVVMGKGGTGLVTVSNDFKVLGVQTILTQATNALDIVDASNSNVVNFRVKRNGHTFCRELQVMVGTFPDYVFDKSYKLRSLAEVESYINSNKHLPGFESAEYYIKNGIKTSEMFTRQQEKIEELTLYLIELEKRLNKVEQSK